MKTSIVRSQARLTFPLPFRKLNTLKKTLITELKSQGPAIIGVAIILSVCIPMFLFALADYAAGVGGIN